MIARIWSGTVRTADAARYADYIRDTGFAEYGRTPGNRGAWLLRRDDRDDATTEFITLSMWDDVAAIRAFAGGDIEAAVLYPEDERYLVDGGTDIRHYEIADHIADPGGERPMSRERQIEELYTAFNRRDADRLLSAMAEDVRWPNGWEGGWLHGRGAVRDYWARQWREIDPTVEALQTIERADGTIAVRVHQVVRQKDGTVLADQEVLHVYRFDGDAIAEMVIEDPPSG